ncbi:MAG: hypothetical protein PVH19_12825 [Planctomycetia bacterium]
MLRLEAVIIATLAVLIMWEPLVAAPPAPAAAPAGVSAPQQQAGQNPRPRPQPQRVVHDIQLKTGYAFRGQLPPDVLARLQRKKGIWIRFYYKNRLIAETRTDELGRFSLQYLPTGPGMLMVGRGKQAKICLCRLWAPGTGPQSANANKQQQAAPNTVARSQNLHVFPTTSFKEVATAVGVVGGAVGTPLIWHNIQQDHKAPVSGH